MTIQNYCMVNKDTNICDNVCLWDGNPDTWTPPANYLMLVQAITPSKIWSYDTETSQWVLIEGIGEGGIDFSWDGTFLISPTPTETTPKISVYNPISTGTQTL